MRKPPRVPKYRHYKPKDLAVVRLDGRDIYLGKYGTPESEERYRRVVAEWFSSGVAASPAEKSSAEAPPDLAVSQLILAFWRFAETHYRRADGSPTGELESYKVTLRPLRELYGSTPASKFGPKALKAVRDEMIRAGLCRKTVNQRVRRIKRLFKWAVENELVPRSSHHALRDVAGLQVGRSPARETAAVKPAPDAHVDAVRPHVPRQIWAMIELQRLTGMRPGEVCIMRTGDLEVSGNVWTYTPSAHKTSSRGHERKIFIGPKARVVLEPWIRTDLAALLFDPREVMAERSAQRRAARKTPLTPSQRSRTPKANPKIAPGRRYKVHSYANAIRRACRKAGVPHWHPHQLRHNAATYLRKTFGLDAARAILGHRSSVVTEVYAEVDFEKARAIMAEVG